MTKRKKAMKIVCIIIVSLIILLLIVYIDHQVHLKMETELRSPLGQIVEVDGHNMSVYIEGTGDMTLVFMSGGGTCSPILDFKSLYSLLSDQYKIAVVEKFGYGFSDIVDKSRDIDSILKDTRAALIEAGLTAPYILCPHSMSGLEALYWAQKYPNAVKYGTLSDLEKEIYKAIFYSRTATVTMINETESVKENAKKVNNVGVPQLPMLLFISDGSGGTGFDKETWRKIPIEYLSKVDDGKYIELDCPHYIHNYEYKKISESIITFLSEQ